MTCHVVAMHVIISLSLGVGLLGWTKNIVQVVFMECNEYVKYYQSQENYRTKMKIFSPKQKGQGYANEFLWNLIKVVL
jgi:hypothetical protein